MSLKIELDLATVAQRLVELAAQAATRPVLNAQLESLRSVVSRFPDGTSLSLAEIVAALYPDESEVDGVRRLRAFRYEFNLLAEGVNLRFVVDGHKHVGAADRRAWFESGADLEALSREANWLPALDLPLVGARARLGGETVRPRLRFGSEGRVAVWVIHHPREAAAVDDLVDRVSVQLNATALPPEVVVSWERRPAMGEDVRLWRQARVDSCALAVVLVSPQLLATSGEGSALDDIAAVVDDVPVLPVLLNALADQPRLGPLQRFADSGFQPRLGETDDRGRPVKPFGTRRAASEKDDLAARVADGIFRWIREDWAPDADPISWDIDVDGVDPIPLRARRTSLEKRSVFAPGDDGEDVQVFLDQWVRNPAGTPYLALLGEYGMGKTISCQLFASGLRGQIDAGQSDVPTPFYFDLRLLAEGGSTGDLESMLETLIARQRASGRLRGPAVTAARVVEAVQEEGAVVIFDGLDEALVHLDTQASRGFLRELLRVLPPAVVDRGEREDADPTEAPPRRGRVVLSCRTHYFRTVAEEHNFLLGEGRDGLEGDRQGRPRYSALYLLPFTDDQVREFLAKRLGEDSPEAHAAYRYLQTVHDLAQLAERPYTLELMVRAFQRIEVLVAEGAAIDGASLYGEVTREWLDRDESKHTFPREHKMRLMEALAAHLASLEVRELSVEKLDAWLAAELTAPGPLRDWFAALMTGATLDERRSAVVRLSEDLRTATFIVRPGSDAFVFAHTSMQEYFLARHLHRALVERAFDGWDINSVSDETLHFLAEIVAAGPGSEFVDGLADLAASYQPRVSELALRFVLDVDEHAPSGSGLNVAFDLAQADLRGLKVDRHARSKGFDLSGCRLVGADLRDAKFANVNLAGADLTRADLTRAEFNGCDLTGAVVRRAILVGTTFRQCSLRDLDARKAVVHRVDVLGAGADDASWPKRRDHWSIYGAPNDVIASEPGRVVAVTHGGRVPSVAWCPDGTALASGDVSGELRVWDSRSGSLIWAKTAHGGGVRSVDWSAGGRLASCGHDATVSVWDVATGMLECSHDLGGGGAWSVAWAPDGTRIAVGGADWRIRVLDAASGEVLWCERASGVARAVRWSQDGRSLASATGDGRVATRDASSGALIWSHVAHGGGAWDVNWSPDGRRLVSGGGDGRLVVWDVHSGSAVQDHDAHSGGAWTADWAPAGRLLASGGQDGQVIIRDARSGAPAPSPAPSADPVWSVSWSSDGRLAMGDDAGAIRIWDAKADVVVSMRQRSPGLVGPLSWSHTGRRLALSSEATLCVWDGETGCIHSLRQPHGDGVLSLEWSPDDVHLAVIDDGGWVTVWDVAGRDVAWSQRMSGAGAVSMTWSPDGRCLASGAGDGAMRVCDATAGDELWSKQAFDNPVAVLAWSPDGDLLAAGGHEGLRVWTVASRRVKWSREPHDGKVQSLAWSPDGAHLTSGDNLGMKVWDVDTRRLSWSRDSGHAGVRSLAWSPNGHALASVSEDRVRLWDASTRKVIWSHEATDLRSASWSATGSEVTAVGVGGSVTTWDPASGAEISCQLSFPDGEWVSQTVDGRVRARSEGAWKWVKWQATDPHTGMLDSFPIEVLDAVT